MERKIINNLEELKSKASKKRLECFISLNGSLRSSKAIDYDKDTETFDIYNEIDDTWQEDLSEQQLKSDTNIVEAIYKKALYLYD